MVPRSRSPLFFLTLASLAIVTHGPSCLADDDVARGLQLAVSLCKTCHLNPGQGEKEGAAGIPSFYAIANRPSQTLDGVIQWLNSRPPMMPDHHLTHDEMHRLAAFIMSLRHGE